MNELDIDILIIGAGPSSMATAMPFIENNQQNKIKIITEGDFVYNELEENKIYENLNKKSLDEKYKYWFDQKKSFKGILPKKEFLTKKNFYDNHMESNIEVNSKLNFDTTSFIGGLSNVWGANVLAPSENDTNIFPFYKKYVNEFEKITKIFSIAGQNDDLDNKLFKINYSKDKISYSSQANFFLNNFKEKKQLLKSNDFKVGLSKLAINTNGDNACENCGLCMFGCHKKSIFNASVFFKEYENLLLKNFEVIKFDEIDNAYKVSVFDKNRKRKLLLDCKKIVLCAGAINTSKILLNSHSKKDMNIKDCNKYHFISLTKLSSKDNEEKKIVGLSNNFYQTNINKNTIHLQTYHWYIITKLILLKFFSVKISDKIINIFRPFFSRVNYGMIYLPSELSDEINIKKTDDKFVISKRKKNYNKRLLILTKLNMKLLKCFFKLKILFVPLLLPCKTGQSQHFGSSTPQKNNPTDFECDNKSKLYPFKNVYIADTSSLERLPSTPTTYLMMANAYKIGKELLIENEK